MGQGAGGSSSSVAWVWARRAARVWGGEGIVQESGEVDGELVEDEREVVRVLGETGEERLEVGVGLGDGQVGGVGDGGIKIDVAGGGGGRMRVRGGE